MYDGAGGLVSGERYVYTPYGKMTVHQVLGFGNRDGGVDALDAGNARHSVRRYSAFGNPFGQVEGSVRAIRLEKCVLSLISKVVLRRRVENILRKVGWLIEDSDQCKLYNFYLDAAFRKILGDGKQANASAREYRKS